MYRVCLSVLLTTVISVTSFAQDVKDIHGSWIAEITKFSSLNDYQEASLTMKWTSEGERFRYTFRIPVDELRSHTVDELFASKTSFSLDREAGKLSFSGSMEDDLGSGKFEFSVNQDFLTKMFTLGYEKISADEQLKMAIYDVTTEFVKSIRAMSESTQS